MLILEYKLSVNQRQHAKIDEAIRVVQFIRNKAIRLWVDGRGVGQYDMQALCAQLAQDYPFAARQEFHGPTGSGRPGLAIRRPLLQELPGEETREEGLSQVPERQPFR